MVFLCNTTLYAYSKEQIAKQNILTLFRWFEEGNLDKTEVKRIIAAVKVQLKVLKNEAASYGYLDNNLRNAIIKGYKYDSDMRLLLNFLFTETVTRLELNKNAPGEKPRHPWLDIRNDLVDRLANELAISFGATTAKGDLTKPEIFIAPDVVSYGRFSGEGFKCYP